MKKQIIFAFIFFLSGCANHTLQKTKIQGDEFQIRAIKILQPKCQDGFLPACNDLGISYQSIQDHENAMKIYKNACDLGYQNACTNLANMYAKGQAVSKDEEKAKQIYSKSCLSGGAYSCYFLGEFFRKNQNFSSAAKAYANGCDLGDVPSCVNLGGLYELGLGVSKDIKKAFNIYKNTCAKSDMAACENLSRLQTGVGQNRP
ncbi:MAG: tetratricopeptide repeat protein [Campylobacter sp.]